MMIPKCPFAAVVHDGNCSIFRRFDGKYPTLGLVGFVGLGLIRVREPSE